MPIYCRYLLTQYFKIFFLCLVSFVAVLLTTRLEEIAHFATLGAEGWLVLLYTMYQIPYILPIAVPISALISGVLVIQKLSDTHELTAFRASGMTLQQLLLPLLLSAAFLSLANFYIISELATHSHLESGNLKSKLRSVNPLLILHNRHLLRMKGLYFDTLGASRIGELASNSILAVPNNGHGRLHLIVAEKLQATSDEFESKNITLITSLNGDEGEKFDALLVENIGTTQTALHDFAQLLQKKTLSVSNDDLRLSLLLAHIKQEEQHLLEAKNHGASQDEMKVIRRSINRSYTDIFRRLSIALAVFTFTLLGVSFGINISRRRSKYGLLTIIGLASLFLVAFFVAKSLEYQYATATMLYLVPHLIIIAASVWILIRIAKGIE